MTICPECDSKDVFRFHKPIDSGGGYGPDVLPKLSNRKLGMAKMLPVVCRSCGLIRIYASQEARAKLADSPHWERA